MVLARSRAKFDKLLPILVEKKLPTDDLHFISIDLSSTDDIRRAAKDANEWAGGCADILVNNGECTAHSTSPTLVSAFYAAVRHSRLQCLYSIRVCTLVCLCFFIGGENDEIWIFYFLRC